jgi:integrase
VEDYKSLRGSRVSNSSVNRELFVLKAILSAHDISLKVRNFKENPHRERILTDEERCRLLEECSKSKRLYLAVQIALSTGLRKEGVYSLRWDNLDLQRRFLTTSRTKGSKKVIIPIVESLYLLLIEEKLQNNSSWIFPSPEDPVKHISLKSDLGFPRACERAGIEDFRFHDLRHLAGSRLYEVSGDKMLVKKFLGHGAQDITDRYIQTPDKRLVEAMKRME